MSQGRAVARGAVKTAQFMLPPCYFSPTSSLMRSQGALSARRGATISQVESILRVLPRAKNSGGGQSLDEDQTRRAAALLLAGATELALKNRSGRVAPASRVSMFRHNQITTGAQFRGVVPTAPAARGDVKTGTAMPLAQGFADQSPDEHLDALVGAPLATMPGMKTAAGLSPAAKFLGGGRISRPADEWKARPALSAGRRRKNLKKGNQGGET